MFFFFFSSRRRHTRLQGDWSSDVCSSDLRRGYRMTLTGAGARLLSMAQKIMALEAEAEFFLRDSGRSEEHTSELQSPCNLVCRLLLEKKNFALIPSVVLTAAWAASLALLPLTSTA